MVNSLTSSTVNPTLSHSNQAIVIGSGIAGLLAARILTQHFDQVVVVERDQLPPNPQPRRGVPQSFHSHILLVKGKQIIESLFPGIGEELKQNGAIEVDLTEDSIIYGINGWIKRYRSNILSYSCTRNLLAYLIRQRLLENPNIQFLTASQVIGLIPNHNQQSLTGISIQSQQQETIITGKLIVDASGRNSKTPRWLETIGYQAPQKIVVNPFVGYATRLYQIPNNFSRDWVCLTIAPKNPDCQRSGLIFTVEGNRWIVTLGGNGKDYPPKDELEFLDFAKSLRHRAIYEAIKQAEPLSPIYAYQGLHNRWYQYEQLAQFPENYIVLGDAFCAFNPTYGKGMTIAGLSAITLDSCLRNRSGLKRFSQFFHNQLSEAVKPSWEMVSSGDLSWSTTKGNRVDNPTNFLKPYFEKVADLTQENLDIHSNFLEVFHMLKSPLSLLEPSIAMRVAEKSLNNTSKPKQELDNHSPLPLKKNSQSQLEKSLQHKYINTNNIRLHYVTQGEGELILFLHGFPEFWYSWRYQIPEFSQHYKVVAVDLRGYNDSDKPQGVEAYNLTELHRDIEGIIRGLGYKNCILVGHDWGGGLAWSFAHSFPQMVNKLIVLNFPHPAKFMQGIQTNFQQMLRSSYMALFQLPIIPEFLFQLNDYYLVASAFIDNAIDKTAFSPKDLEAYKNAAAKRGALTAMINYYRALLQLPPKQFQWDKLTIPTLLIWGENDSFLGKELTQDTQAYVQDLQIKYIPNCSHWVQQEKPELVNQHMADFLRNTN